MKNIFKLSTLVILISPLTAINAETYKILINKANVNGDVIQIKSSYDSEGFDSSGFNRV